MAPRGTSICLFDWRSVGHHIPYARAIAEALTPVADVTVAAPDELLEQLPGLEIERYSLGAGRPSDAAGTLTEADTSAALAGRELELLREVCDATGAAHVFHLYTDPVLRWWLKQEPMPASMAILVFHPRAHYPRAYDTPISARDRLSGRYLEHKVRRWRRRPDAEMIFSPDPAAARIWAGKPGAPAHWLPEPPVELPDGDPAPDRPRGCVLFGVLETRKGIDLLADALALAPTDIDVLLAGNAAPNAVDAVERSVKRMRAAGAVVELRLGFLSQSEAMRALASARCAVLPYRWHPGTSRVMTEAAAVGTPVVGPNWGLTGSYIRDYEIGIAVDPTDPVALREAVLELSEDADAPARYAPSLRRYTEAVGGAAFAERLRSAFGLTPGSP